MISSRSAPTRKYVRALARNKVFIFIDYIVDCKLILLFLSYDHNLLISHFFEIVIGLLHMKIVHRSSIQSHIVEIPIYVIILELYMFCNIYEIECTSYYYSRSICSAYFVPLRIASNFSATSGFKWSYTSFLLSTIWSRWCLCVYCKRSSCLARRMSFCNSLAGIRNPPEPNI